MRGLLVGLLVSVIFVSCSSSKKSEVGKKPSSDIPERREFPVNNEINPCDDFYGYACSKVDASFKLREDRSSHTFAFNDSHERLLKKKEEFLADLENQKGLSHRGAMLKNYYLACMNEKASAGEEREYVKNMVRKISRMRSRNEFLTYMGDQILSGEFTPMDFGTISNLDDPDWNDIYILADWMSLPERSYYDKPDVYSDFEEYITKFFETLGEKEAKERAKAVAAFEKEFAQTYPLPVEFRDLISKKTGITRSEIQSNYPQLRLGALLTKIPLRTHIRHLTPDNFGWLNKTYRSEKLSLLKDVYLFHALKNYMDDAYPEFFKVRFKFANKHLGGPPVRPPRGERCTKAVMGGFAKEIDAELLPKIFPNFPEQRFIKLAESVRRSIIDGLKSNNWLTESTRQEAITKIKNARLQLVKPRNNKEWDFNLPGDYSSDRPYENGHLFARLSNQKAFHELGQKRNKDKWGMGPLTINAYYSPSDNKFVMPMGILQYPFFDPKLSDEANLGAVGAVIGHELGHGIDDKGSRYDSEGKLRDWFSEKDMKEFKSRGEKLVAQFNKIGHNGELTLGENIGDLVGVTFAYRTAFPGNKGSLERKRDFFVQFGRVWCNVKRPKFKEMQLKTDPHSLGEARVNEQMKHQPGFSEAFQCHPGNKMVLGKKDRVEIW